MKTAKTTQILYIISIDYFSFCGHHWNRKNLIISNILIDFETDLVTVKLMWNRLLSIVGEVTDTKHSYREHSADLCQSLLIWGVSNHQGLSLPHPVIKTIPGVMHYRTLSCSVQNFNTIGLFKQMLWGNEILSIVLYLCRPVMNILSRSLF